MGGLAGVTWQSRVALGRSGASRVFCEFGGGRVEREGRIKWRHLLIWVVLGKALFRPVGDSNLVGFGV